jgi:hypothetical protein
MNEATAAIKQAIEATALPTGITVSGLTFFGMTLDDWVFVGTATLLTCNLLITLPKVYQVMRRLISYAKSKRRK